MERCKKVISLLRMCSDSKETKQELEEMCLYLDERRTEENKNLKEEIS